MNLYGIFFGSKWAMTRNKRQALKWGRQNHALVTVLSNAYGYGSNLSWDAPTLRATSDVLADFRQ